MAADYFCQTLDPEDPEGSKVDAIFPGDWVLRLYKHAPAQYQNLIAAKFLLENVKCIFWGVRLYNEGGRCYTGRAVSWFIRERIEVPFPEHLVFTVYLNPRMRVYECRAEIAAPDDPLAPVDWRERFRGLKWKSTS